MQCGLAFPGTSSSSVGLNGTWAVYCALVLRNLKVEYPPLLAEDQMN
jgi:hypothetical protein